MAAALDVSHPKDAVGKVRRRCAVKTAMRQNKKAEPNPLRDLQLVKIADKRANVFRRPC